MKKLLGLDRIKDKTSAAQLGDVVAELEKQKAEIPERRRALQKRLGPAVMDGDDTALEEIQAELSELDATAAIIDAGIAEATARRDRAAEEELAEHLKQLRARGEPIVKEMRRLGKEYDAHIDGLVAANQALVALQEQIEPINAEIIRLGKENKRVRVPHIAYHFGGSGQQNAAIAQLRQASPTPAFAHLDRNP